MLKLSKGAGLPDVLIVGAILGVLGLITYQGVNRPGEVCIKEVTVAEILSVSKHETLIKYTDGTLAKIPTHKGVIVGDVVCLVYR